MKCSQCGADIPANSAFCPECGAKLKKNPIMLWLAIGLLVIVALVVWITASSRSTSSPVVEPTHQEQPTREQKVPKKVTKESANTHTLPYGKWSGAWKNGQPDGNGTLVYSQEHLIDKRDRKQRMAAPGDYIIGEFSEGKLVQGVLYDAYNNTKASIIIGM